MGFLALALTLATAAAAPCSAPTVPTRVLNAFPPETPAAALKRGISGVVNVSVSLDAASHVTKLVIESSANEILNDASLAAARESTYATNVVNCRPVPSTYRYVVEFISGEGPAPDVVDPRSFLTGSWTCLTAGGASRPETYEFDPKTARFLHHTGNGSENIAYAGRNTWNLVSADENIRERAGAWVYGWFFRGTASGQPVTTSYLRIDTDSFTRITDDGKVIPALYLAQTCRRDHHSVSFARAFQALS